MATIRPAGPSDRMRRLAGVVLGVSLLCAAVPASTALAATRAYSMDLGLRADFVAQTNNVQCVGASMQMMLNMMRRGADRTAATQRRLQQLARAFSGPRPDGFVRRGASVRGWAAGLTMRGGGPYRVDGASTIEEATLMAARAIRRTGRPAGLLVWSGRHAWVMSGFSSTIDPLLPGARITNVVVEDPLYPAVSRQWGRSPAPGAVLSLGVLGHQFVPRWGSWWSSGLDGQYVVVLPYEFDARLLRDL
jgi:hypothetical protein